MVLRRPDATPAPAKAVPRNPDSLFFGQRFFMNSMQIQRRRTLNNALRQARNARKIFMLGQVRQRVQKYSAGIPHPSQAERRKNANGRLLYKIKIINVIGQQMQREEQFRPAEISVLLNESKKYLFIS